MSNIIISTTYYEGNPPVKVAGLTVTVDVYLNDILQSDGNATTEYDCEHSYDTGVPEQDYAGYKFVFLCDGYADREVIPRP